MNDLRKAAQNALDALCHAANSLDTWEYMEQINELRAALNAPQPSPSLLELSKF